MFLSDPVHRIRFLFRPKHSSWLNQVEIVFGIVMRKAFRRGNFASLVDLEAELKAFLAYFNLVLAHPFHWTRTGKPAGARATISLFLGIAFTDQLASLLSWNNPKSSTALGFSSHLGVIRV